MKRKRIDGEIEGFMLSGVDSFDGYSDWMDDRYDDYGSEDNWTWSLLFL